MLREMDDGSVGHRWHRSPSDLQASQTQGDGGWNWAEQMVV
ncbi:hypothetical protein FM120_35100 [Sphingobacterium faecium PCAi_F2.5]|nr:hypothetical protein FM120_35100 [Sphingobacterium faecium PCAi_F2.5]